MTRKTPRNIELKMTKFKETDIGSNKIKKELTYEENSLRLTIDLSNMTLQSRREWRNME